MLVGYAKDAVCLLFTYNSDLFSFTWLINTYPRGPCGDCSTTDRTFLDYHNHDQFLAQRPRSLISIFINLMSLTKESVVKYYVLCLVTWCACAHPQYSIDCS
jgi:hypothetical protein